MIELELNWTAFRASPLIAGLTQEELERFTALWGVRLFRVEKRENIDRQLARQHPGCMACLLSGGALVKKGDAEGNQAVLDFARPGCLMGCCGALTDMPFRGLSIAATAPSRILVFRPQPLPTAQGDVCALRLKIQKNLMGILAQHSWQLMKKAEILSCRSLREKVLAFLSAQREYFHSDSFELPMDRQTLADYLYINRSALSRELGKLREEGLINYRRSRFVLLFPPANM